MLSLADAAGGGKRAERRRLLDRVAVLIALSVCKERKVRLGTRYRLWAMRYETCAVPFNNAHKTYAHKYVINQKIGAIALNEGSEQSSASGRFYFWGSRRVISAFGAISVCVSMDFEMYSS